MALATDVYVLIISQAIAVNIRIIVKSSLVSIKAVVFHWVHKIVSHVNVNQALHISIVQLVNAIDVLLVEHMMINKTNFYSRYNSHWLDVHFYALFKRWHMSIECDNSSMLVSERFRWNTMRME
jgi:hypothetical protein